MSGSFKDVDLFAYRLFLRKQVAILNTQISQAAATLDAVRQKSNELGIYVQMVSVDGSDISGACLHDSVVNAAHVTVKQQFTLEDFSNE